VLSVAMFVVSAKQQAQHTMHNTNIQVLDFSKPYYHVCFSSNSFQETTCYNNFFNSIVAAVTYYCECVDNMKEQSELWVNQYCESASLLGYNLSECQTANGEYVALEYITVNGKI
jgi:hypothetical protein